MISYVSLYSVLIIMRTQFRIIISTILWRIYLSSFNPQCHLIGTFVEAIDSYRPLCYTIIAIDFCAPSVWDNWNSSVRRRFAALHTLLSLYAGSGIAMPTTFLFHIYWIMEQGFQRDWCSRQSEYPNVWNAWTHHLGVSRRSFIVADCKGGTEKIEKGCLLI